MRVGILADIHGNIEALSAVLKEIQELSISRLLIAGDFIGYYYHPKEVIDILSDYGINAIKGNHELYLYEFDYLSAKEKAIFRSKYGAGTEKAHSGLSDVQKQWLSNLKENDTVDLNGKSILLCHGSPWDINEYIYADCSDELWGKFDSVKNDIIVMGHTHYPFHKNVSGKIILNPGSVGQPRNGARGANWALLDTLTLQIEIMDSGYDFESVINEARSIDPEVIYLQNVLMRGKNIRPDK